MDIKTSLSKYEVIMNRNFEHDNQELVGGEKVVNTVCTKK